ncbi:MAG TPA: DUF3617 family protein [Caulobacteraceae bacterium]|nr:DUF3617 family protein [Caulobacteraceae bacterium]
MTIARIAGASLLVLALAACHRPGAAGGADQSRMALPGAEAQARKAGLWEQKVSDGQSAQVTRLCLDAASHTAIAYLGQSLNHDLCKSHTMTRAADGSWSFTSVCRQNGVDVTSKGVATGDFTKGYQIRMETQAPGEAPRRYVVDAAWKGPCPADMKPGDIVGPDGRKVRIAELKTGAAS